MKIEKTIENLKKLHASYTEDVKLLTEKRDRIVANLAEATEQAEKTLDAINALEGKETLKQTLLTALANQKAASATNPAPISAAPSHLPPPEPGMQWAKNSLGEDVLVVINPPPPVGLSAADATNFILPEINESFDSPDLQ